MSLRVAAKWLLIPVVVAYLLLGQLFKLMAIPSGSMMPTLEVGDYVLVPKWSYGFSGHTVPGLSNSFEARWFGSKPKRGDIAVFTHPADGRSFFIARIIGLPGEAVQMIEGRLHVDGKLVEREALPPQQAEGPLGNKINIPTYREALPGGVGHMIIEIENDSGFNDNTGVFKIPAGHYFVMGDHRDNSTDSRVPRNQGGVGFVPSENLVGRADRVLFGLKKYGSALQPSNWQRFLQTVE